MEVRLAWAVIMVLLYSVLPGTYAVIAASVGLAFGPLYYAPNLGLIFSATLAYFSIIIIVSQVGSSVLSPIPSHDSVRLMFSSTCWATRECSSWRGPRLPLVSWSPSVWRGISSTREKTRDNTLNSRNELNTEEIACSWFISI